MLFYVYATFQELKSNFRMRVCIIKYPLYVDSYIRLEEKIHIVFQRIGGKNPFLQNLYNI
jgi:hypothetical protein